MSLSNYYNFRNAVRHFINIDQLNYPDDIESFDPIKELCWTKPILLRVYKSSGSFRALKLPNILNYVRAYHYYKVLPNFTNVIDLDIQHKRLEANLDTGDFVSGNYNKQLDGDFVNLCNYDLLLKLDISEYYGRIYTHYLGLDKFNLGDEPLAWLNYGRTSGILMGNYLSLYFAEYMTSKISEELQLAISNEDIDCVFNYFSDDFYFFCNESDAEMISSIFDKTLTHFDFTRKKKTEIWTYETYNEYNLLTRYWKATVRAWNLEVLKDLERNKKYPKSGPIKHKFTFLNQLVYRLSGLKDEKSKRGFITNFFKTNHFQEIDCSDYELKPYDLHQLMFLIKSSPESLLYVTHVIKYVVDIDRDKILKDFLKARYRESLKHELHDVQLYYYYVLKELSFDDVLQEVTELVIESQNQILISYYLKDNYFTQSQVNTLKLIDGEEYWFQNYHLILFTESLYIDLDNSIKKYLLPERLTTKPNSVKEAKYINFYKTNLGNRNMIINEILQITENITDYLTLRNKETAGDFDE